jgi:GNAT superfamily N-acetyltransferase
MADLVYRHQSIEYTGQLVDLERRAFPNMDPNDLIGPETVALQQELFPEGAFMVLDGDRVVAMASGIFVDYDIERVQHDLHEVIGLHGVGNHDPDGEWYYGIDIAVDPEYRGRGIASELYRLRKQLVVDRNRRGIIAGGVLPGYRNHKDEMTALEYVEKVQSGELTDPTLTAQIKNGFAVLGVIEDYVVNPIMDNWASFIAWFNPRYDPDGWDDDVT